MLNRSNENNIGIRVGVQSGSLNVNQRNALINDLNQLVNYSLSSFGVEPNFVLIIPADASLTPVAGALGITFNEKVSVGAIFVNLDLLVHLTQSERFFTIAHECAHIFNNHLVSTILVSIPTISMKLLDLFSMDPSKKVLVNFLKNAAGTMNWVNINNYANTIRDQEITADCAALKITGDFVAARSCLLKLCNNDLNSISHYFEFEGIPKPIMTVEQRMRYWNQC